MQAPIRDVLDLVQTVNPKSYSRGVKAIDIATSFERTT